MCFLLFVLNSSWVRLEELHFSLTSFFEEVVKLVEAVIFTSDAGFTLAYSSGSQSLARVRITSLEVSPRPCYRTPDSRVAELIVTSTGIDIEQNLRSMNNV